MHNDVLYLEGPEYIQYGNKILNNNMLLLLDQGIDIDRCYHDGWTALIYAAQCIHPFMLELALHNGAYVNYVNPNNGWTALTYACFHRRMSNIRMLLEWGADPNITDNAEVSILMLSLRHCDITLIELLLEHGANPNTKDKVGRTPMYICLNRNKKHKSNAIIDLLKKYGASS